MECGQHRFPRPAQRAFQLLLQRCQLLMAGQLGHLVATDRVRIAARPAGDPQRTFEADEIGCRADVLGGHAAGICAALEWGKNEKGTYRKPSSRTSQRIGF